MAVWRSYVGPHEYWMLVKVHVNASGSKDRRTSGYAVDDGCKIFV